MAEEQDKTQTAPEKSGGGIMKMAIFGGIAVVLLIAGVFAGPAIKNMTSPAPTDEEAADESAVDSSDPEIFQSLHPPLIVNFKDSAGNSHYMQITMEVMSRDQETINAVRDHTPVIRNALILHFGGADYDFIITREGKEQMLADALAEIQSVMEERYGDTGVEEVYFTSLIIQ